MRQSFTHTHTFPPFHSHIHPPRASTRPPRASNPLKTSRLASPHRPILSSSRLPPHLSRRVASRRVASRTARLMAFSGRAKFPPPYLDITLDRPSADAPSSSSSPARDKGGVEADREEPRGGRGRSRVAGECLLLGLTVVQYECRVRVVPFLFSGRVLSVVFRTHGSYSHECMRHASVCVNERMGSIVDRVVVVEAVGDARRADARVSAEDVVASRWHGGRRDGG